MWARKRIDIGWFDLLCVKGWTVFPWGQKNSQSMLETMWSANADALACLSVRSGFDLLLGQLQLPQGSEVLMSAVTIQDMARIIEHHGLVPVPVDLDPATMAPVPEELERAITPQTKVILIAHLFGGIIDFTPYTEIAAMHDLILIEDCAQAFDGDQYKGHPQSDVVMFSFGPIKTATALGGGILTVHDRNLLFQMRAKQSDYPVQKRIGYLKRACTYTLLKLIGSYYAFGMLVKICKFLGRDYETLLNGVVRNFPADEFFDALRQQPCTPLCLLMCRRINKFSLLRQDRRIEAGRLLNKKLSPYFHCPSGRLIRHTYWVLPVEVDHDSDIATRLRENGFDAATASQLRPVSPPETRPDQIPQQAIDCLSRVIYLPLYPEIPDFELIRMADLMIENQSDS